MVTTDECHMVLTSSHKAGQDTKTFLEFSTLRIQDIIINNISHVCQNHLLSMLDSNVTASNCICYMFQQPQHITCDSTYKRILNCFYSNNQGDGMSKSDPNNQKAAMLSEIGILPPLNYLGNLNGIKCTQLAAPHAKNKLCSNLLNITDILNGTNKNKKISREVVVYIDPAPTDVGRSYHAMCFVTRAENIHPSPDAAQYNYIILAVDEFETRNVCPDSMDGLSALASVFMNTCSVLTTLYNGYFQTYYVAPEANSMHIDNFWRRCSHLLVKMKLPGIKIVSTLIPIPHSKDSYHGESKIHRHINKEFRSRPYTTGVGNLLTDLVEHQNKEHFRIGYTLGMKKVPKIYNFYTTLYNPSSGKINDLVCSDMIWSFWIRKNTKCLSIPYYIGLKLEDMELRPITNSVTGKTTYKISGKKGSTGPHFVQDDLAISVIMSVMLCMEILTNMYTGKTVLLTPNIQNDSEDIVVMV